MSHTLILFCLIVAIFSLLQSRAAYRRAYAQTIYHFTDRLSWIIGGLLALGIGVWQPWFTATWWKAVGSDFLFPILMARFSGSFIDSLLTMEPESKQRRATRLARKQRAPRKDRGCCNNSILKLSPVTFTDIASSTGNLRIKRNT